MEERERERERVREDSRKLKQEKILGKSDRRFISRRRKIILLLEGSQAVPARPDKNRV
jgi:hypothetical protein